MCIRYDTSSITTWKDIFSAFGGYPELVRCHRQWKLFEVTGDHGLVDARKPSRDGETPKIIQSSLDHDFERTMVTTQDPP